MTNSNTIDIAGAPAPVKSESSIASVRRMLKNSLLISIRDSVLLKLATVDLLLVVFYIGLLLGALYLIPALAGEPCHTTEELNAFYNHHVHLGMHWISACILITFAFATQFLATLFTNFLLLTVDSEIIRVWNGQKADFKRGWRTAASHFWSLVTWSLLIAPFNFMWVVSMCIVIPVLTRDKTVNPFKMLGRAVLLLLKIWKEFLLGIVGMLVIVYWVFCLVFGSNVIFTAISSQCPPLIAWVLLSVGIIFSLLALCFCYLFCNVYLCGQYIKASEGVEPNPEADPAELA
ncbi:MAG: hypothetical protein J6Y92_10320 [Lentisphaeria bacterium]|nr:hypothetical protein [Lentisphaeria bacterium]